MEGDGMSIFSIKSSRHVPYPNIEKSITDLIPTNKCLVKSPRKAFLVGNHCKSITYMAAHSMLVDIMKFLGVLHTYLTVGNPTLYSQNTNGHRFQSTGRQGSTIY